MKFWSKLFAAALMVMGTSDLAWATNCGSFPYTLTNGTTADANQVMANFNALLNCSNSNLLGKANNLSDVSSISTSRTNLGLGTSATANAGNAAHTVVTVLSAVNGHFPQFTGTTGDAVDSGYTPLSPANNLSDVANSATALANLGAQASLGFTPLNPANNLSDVANAGLSRANLGLTVHATAHTSNLGSNATYSESNPLGALPAVFELNIYVVCTSADAGYSIGDVVRVNFGGASHNDGVTPWVNSTTMGWAVGQNGIFINPKGGGGGVVISSSNWAIFEIVKYN